MATVAHVPNIAAGSEMEYVRRVDTNDPTNSAIVIVLFSTGDTVANMRDFDSVSAILAGASVESNFTNYARTVLTDTDINSPTIDDSGNTANWDLADQSPLISSAGGTVDEDIDMVVFAYDPDSTVGTDADLIPIYFCLDDGAAALQTTNGSDLNLVINVSGVFTATPS